ncbi:MAG: peptidoglycan DD-metalloendopeptidase family protein [Salinisphaera sp.]|nr:peptidoglycan DD-metalloendopeptidase family protein [Salinisphaera sp.]
MDTGRGNHRRIRRLSAVVTALLLALVLGGCSFHRMLAPESYRVQRGDTLFAIGAQFGINWHNLARWNHISPPYNLAVGQKLWLDPYPPIDYSSLPGNQPQRGQATGAANDEADRSSVAASGPPAQGKVDAPSRQINQPPPQMHRTIQRAPSRWDTAPAATPQDSASKASQHPQPPPDQTTSAAHTGSSTSGDSSSAQAAGDDARITQASKAAAAAAAPIHAGGPSEDGWQWPATGSLIRQYDPNDGRQGIEIGGQLGAPVYSASSGTVVYNGSGLKGYGKLIIIKHDAHYLSAYGFNQRSLVTQGQTVAAGAHIADMGLGPQNKPMLHFEIRHDGDPIDPVKVLPAH